MVPNLVMHNGFHRTSKTINEPHRFRESIISDKTGARYCFYTRDTLNSVQRQFDQWMKSFVNVQEIRNAKGNT